MSEENIPQLISDYRTQFQQNPARYILRARIQLLLLELTVWLLPFLFVAVLVCAVGFIAFSGSPVLFDVLAFTTVLSIAIVRLRSFHTVFRDAHNVMVSQIRKPSFGGVAVLVLIGLAVAGGIRGILDSSPGFYPWVAIAFGVILFLILRMHTLLLEVFRFHVAGSLGNGVSVEDAAGQKLLDEVTELAGQGKGRVKVKKLFIANSIDIGIGRVETENRRFHRNAIVVGLPLLQSVSPDQFRALLRSELVLLGMPVGRLFLRYVGKLSAWQRLLQNLSDKRHWANSLFSRLHSEFTPRIVAHLFHLSRISHSAGDAAVVKSGYLSELRDGLANLAYKHRIMAKLIWPGLYRKADDTGATTLDPFTEIQAQLAAEQDLEEAKLKLNEALSMHDNVRLVPGPSERLGMLNVTAPVPDEQQPAADYYLGDFLPRVIENVNKSWNQSFSDSYSETLFRRRQVREDLESLLQEAESTSDAVKESRLLLRAGQISEELMIDESDWEEPLELYRRAIFANPNSAAAHLAAARLLLTRGEDEGLDLLRSILQSTDEVEPRVYAYEITESYMRQKGLADELKQFEEEYFETWKSARTTLNSQQLAAEKERASLQPGDPLQHHELSEKDVRALRRVLERYPLAREAWLVRKQVQYFTEYPFYILGVELKRPWSWLLLDPGSEVFYAQRIAEELSFLQGSLAVLLLDSNNRISATVRGVPGAHIYAVPERIDA